MVRSRVSFARCGVRQQPPRLAPQSPRPGPQVSKTGRPCSPTAKTGISALLSNSQARNPGLALQQPRPESRPCFETKLGIPPLLSNSLQFPRLGLGFSKIPAGAPA